MTEELNQIADEHYQAFEKHYRDNSKEVTIMFADVEGSTELKERDFINGLYLIRVFFKQVHDVVENPNFSGNIVKKLGDGVLVRFEGDDSAIRAVNAALALQESSKKNNQCELSPTRRFLFSIGISIGPVIDLDGDDPHGTPADLSARLCSIAKGGQILICSNTKNNVPPAKLKSEFQIRENIEPQRLISEESYARKIKGISEPVEIFQANPFADFQPVSWPSESLLECKDLHIKLTNLLNAEPAIIGRIKSIFEERINNTTIARAVIAWVELDTIQSSLYNELRKHINESVSIKTDADLMEYVNNLDDEYKKVLDIFNDQSLGRKQEFIRQAAQTRLFSAMYGWFSVVKNFQETSEELLKSLIMGTYKPKN